MTLKTLFKATLLVVMLMGVCFGPKTLAFAVPFAIAFTLGAAALYWGDPDEPKS